MAVLVDEDGSPPFLPNVYATVRYRDRGAALATTEKVLRTIGMAYLWAHARKIDIHTALTSETFLTLEQCEDLANFLRMSRAGQDADLKASITTKPQKIIRLEQARGRMAAAQSHDHASAAEGGYRIQVLARFLEHHHERICNQVVSEDREGLKDARQKAIRRLRSLAPRTGSPPQGDPVEGLPEATMIHVEEIFSKESPKNPFKKGFIQARNLLMFRILSDNGMRRDELRHVRIDDVDYARKRVKVRVSKTRPRNLVISQKTADLFREFVKDHWSNVPPRKRAHGYLFITRSGNQISLSALNLIFQVARESSELTPNYFTPHTMRRTWNDRLSRKIDAMPPEKRMSIEEEEKIRNHNNGWSFKSDMAPRYSARSIREKADRIAEELANEIADKV
ncbi:site-specific integrase (plasmid) [Pseudomonas sp. LY-1]|uniref:tyrosine-type recombinase/integrase n=1 Tax=Pseudomonas TaxID=286 RepID=UPI0024473F34|nr:tyrosine-type recombinase/integrase [Pseudomonas juntendi]MDG9891066.1 site-specific integrase [Pseudomonas juntendi]